MSSFWKEEGRVLQVYLLRDLHAWGMGCSERGPPERGCGWRLRTKLCKSVAAALACAFSPDKMEKTWGGEGGKRTSEKAAAPHLMYF